MNLERLEAMIKEYMDQFSVHANTQTHDEMSKWRTAYACKKWDNDAEDFFDMFQRCTRESHRLLSGNSIYQPRLAVENLVRKDRGDEADVVREYFKLLLDASPKDLKKREASMDDFIQKMNDLEEECLMPQQIHKLDKRACLMFMGLVHPKTDYMYKQRAVDFFREYLEYEGSGTFQLASYYAFCDAVVAEIEQHEDLIEMVTQELKKQAKMYKMPGLEKIDMKHHILLYDLMYVTEKYGFKTQHEEELESDNKPRGKQKTKAEREQEARDKRKKQLYDELESLRDTIIDKEIELDKIDEVNVVGEKVKHFKFGDGEIIEKDHDIATIRFRIGEKKMSMRFVAERKMLQNKDLTSAYMRRARVEREIQEMEKRVESDEQILINIKNIEIKLGKTHV